MGLAKKGQNLNPALYDKINEAFIDLYGEKAGWAHQILFAGQLTAFQEKINESEKKESKKRALPKENAEDSDEEDIPKDVKTNKKRKLTKK